MNFRLYLIIIIIFSASSTASTTPSNEVNFEIKPITCMVKQAGQRCEMTAKIAWQSPFQRDLCLFQEEQKLQCWEQTAEAKSTQTISLSKSMIFSLRDAKNNMIAKQTIELHTSVNQQYRRKLRSDWSVF
ncbi:DUF3019 domain-containing protein [Pseudoalteromonas peptidolytica]|uniref:DUF3019 domain-containing protein n=1 Tax=Pseudoalteromonas peptidolytica F12-50-A1 TaxID=1315280 RepID=A0A8I0MZI7_9GAMM|nr:DUF3019 domain-containing protein [Pseudoalteromonas peptidolytica]MBE0348997.1 hypothetical protein [Pseudoalteromonas peptidolytica F12-50-A1]NLR15829.1 DUF3019 domain-containing protein [Pseudoalteromonas peptidolytica]GEK09494.1 hypothetical protein PPE03_17430 [Pseudoalteromonas peptidolytica]